MAALFNKQYTIGDLMNIDGTRQTKASNCSVELIKTFHELKNASIVAKFRSFIGGRSIVPAYYVIFKFNVISDTGKKHTVFIRTDPDFNLRNWASNKVQVYCDCEDFKYRSAYTLNQHKSLFLNDKTKVSLGASMIDAPKRKSLTSLLCKHSFAALNWLVNNYANVMKMI